VVKGISVALALVAVLLFAALHAAPPSPGSALVKSFADLAQPWQHQPALKASSHFTPRVFRPSSVTRAQSGMRTDLVRGELAIVPRASAPVRLATSVAVLRI